MRGLLLLPDRLQGRARRQRLDAVCQASAGDRAVLDRHQGDGEGKRAQSQSLLRPDHLHALRRGSLPAGLPGGGGHLPAGRRTGHHRSRGLHGLQALRGELPLRRPLLQRRSQHRSEVHRVRSSAGRRLAGAPLCRCVPHGRHAFRRGGGARRLDRQGRSVPSRPRTQDQGLLPQPAQEVHRRHAVRSGGGRSHRRGALHAQGRSERRDVRRPRPTATATSGSRA